MVSADSAALTPSAHSSLEFCSVTVLNENPLVTPKWDKPYNLALKVLHNWNQAYAAALPTN